MLKLNLIALLSILLLVHSDVPNFTLPMLLAMVCGFSVRLGLDWSNSRISWKNTIIQLIYAVSLSYMGLFAWNDFNIRWNIVYYQFTVSCFSIVVVYEGRKAIELGVKNYFRRLISNIMAKDDRV